MRVLTLIMLGKVLEKISKTSAKDNLGYQKLEHNKPWSDDKCLKLIDPMEAG
jgi:hypothetical protein